MADSNFLPIGMLEMQTNANDLALRIRESYFEILYPWFVVLLYSEVEAMTRIRDIRFSQNFIRSPDLVRKLIGLTDITENDLLIEIGPGKGMITRELVKVSRKVIAIEVDPNFVTALLKLPHKNLEIVHGDFLEWNLPKARFKVFSNIPFDQTADIVSKLTRGPRLPDDAYLIMQEEAAKRFLITESQRKTQISVLTALDFSVEVIQRIERKNFEPVPQVNIVLARFKRKPIILSETERKIFRDFVVYGFNQWAPTALEAFRKVYTSRQRSVIAKRLKIFDKKPSDLVLEEWLGLFDVYLRFVDLEKKKIVIGSEGRLIRQQAKLNKVHRTRTGAKTRLI